MGVKRGPDEGKSDGDGTEDILKTSGTNREKMGNEGTDSTSRLKS